MRRTLIAGFVTILLATPVYSAEPSHRAHVALFSLNNSFIGAHGVAQKLNLASGGPIILLRGEELVLVRNGTETAVKIIHPEFEVYKTFAHMPVTLYLMLGPPGVGELDSQRIRRLCNYRAKMLCVEKHIDNIGLEGAALQRQKQMLTESKQFLEQIIEQRHVSMEELYAFTRGMLPMIKANLRGAAKSELDAIHQQVMAWKKEIPPDQWQQLRVTIKGAVLARDGSLAKQYFERVLGVDHEGARLAYMERYALSTPMITLLTTHAVDGGIAIAIFDEPDRMFRDVLSDAAREVIAEMKFD